MISHTKNKTMSYQRKMLSIDELQDDDNNGNEPSILS